MALPTDDMKIGLHFRGAELSRAIVSGSVFKYVTADVAIRFLDSWHLKYGTYNDAFEMRPIFSLDNALPQDMAESLREEPIAAEIMRDAMVNGYRRSVGALCLSRAPENALMWGHYADGYRGARLEFDASDPAFSRGHPERGTGYGRLFPVVYVHTPTELVLNPFDVYSSVEQSCLTKSRDWAYEAECRLLWPLADPDRSVIAGGTEHLLYFVGPRALRSVTLGVDASRETEEIVGRLLADRPESAHVVLQRTHRHAMQFELVYERLSR